MPVKKRGLALVLVLMSGTLLFQESSDSINLLEWIAGCWESVGPHRQYEEHWMSPSGGGMLGMSRTIAGGKTVFFEFLRIVETDSGTFYTAQPRGRQETRFRLVELDGSKAIFENPRHDFPQRIIYHRHSGEELLASTEGVEKGKHRVEHFPMRRKSCDK